MKVHLRDEDQGLYPELMRAEEPSLRELAQTFRETMGGLSAEFVIYYERCVVPGAIESDGAGFFVETDRILAALLRRIEREDSELYALADHVRA